jgi:hypothetical protein
MAGSHLQRFSNAVMPLKEVMEIVLGALFRAQQEFFYWLGKAKTVTVAANRPALPDDSILKELEMGTYKIGKAPETWSCFVVPPKEAKTSSSTPKTKAAGDNLQLGVAMQKHYKDSGSPARSLPRASTPPPALHRQARAHSYPDGHHHGLGTITHHLLHHVGNCL